MLLSGRVHTRPVTNYTAYQTSAGTQYLFNYDKYNSEYLPWFSKLDIKVSMPYSIFSLFYFTGLDNFETSTYVDLINVFNTENITGYSYTVQNNSLVRVPAKDFHYFR